jgi:hypothetical protein
MRPASADDTLHGLFVRPTVSGEGQWLRGYAMALACAVAFGANPLIPFQRSQNISSNSPTNVNIPTVIL